MKFITNGREFEFHGEIRPPKRGEWYLQQRNGEPHKSMTDSSWDNENDRAIIYPVPITHVFGGLRFVETGEFRQVRKDEWFIVSMYSVPEIRCYALKGQTVYPHTIVRFVEEN